MGVIFIFEIVSYFFLPMSFIQFPLQFHDLRPDAVVLGHPLFQKGVGERDLSGDPPGGEDVFVGVLVVGVLEPLDLDQPALHKTAQDIVHPAEADAKPLRQFSLGEDVVCRELFQEIELVSVHEGMVQTGCRHERAQRCLMLRCL